MSSGETPTGSLAGKAALVTGATRGLGAAAAAELAARGARVAVLGRNGEDAAKVAAGLAGGEHLGVAADVRDGASLEAAVAAAAERFGRLDVVVANAGVNRHGSVTGVSGDDYADVVATNLVGPYRTVRAALDPLIASAGFVMIVSSVASFAAAAGMSSYASTKAGLDMLAHTLHLDLEPHGVGVGVIVPTWIETDMLGSAEREMPAFAELRSSTAGLLGMLTHGVPGGPLGEAVTAAECAAALVDGVEARRRRVWLPPILEELWRLGPLLNGEIGEALTAKLFGAFAEEAEAQLRL